LSDQYAYDNNGNVTSDALNSNYNMIYDHRNLLVQSENNLSQYAFRTYYRYDEAGNRICKMQYMYELGEPPIGGENDSIIVDEGDGDGFWSIVERTYYVRDVSGKEIGVYEDTTLSQWNVWGLDNTGKLTTDGNRYFYIKDHLGSIRAVLNEDSRIANAQDYDAWGYILENRSDNPGNSMYKFTGKERDKDLENNYDYFGARYYDSRIGRWGGVEPKIDKYPGSSPYVYAFLNPMILKDVNGKDFAYAATSDKEGKYKIYISVPYDYTTNGDYGLRSEKESMLKKYISNANERWNIAAKKVTEYKGNKVDIVFNIYLNNPRTSEFIASKIRALTANPTGENVAINNTTPETGIYKGFEFLIGIEPEIVQNRGAHEAAHSMGLPDTQNSQEEGTITSYFEDRDVSEQDVINVLNQIDLQKGYGVVRGAIGDSNK
jgi:RHS repeat-associated protein